MKKIWAIWEKTLSEWVETEDETDPRTGKYLPHLFTHKSEAETYKNEISRNFPTLDLEVKRYKKIPRIS
jgi:hypothetical protein